MPINNDSILVLCTAFLSGSVFVLLINALGASSLNSGLLLPCQVRAEAMPSTLVY